MENNAIAATPTPPSTNNIAGTTTPPPSNNNATKGESSNDEHLIDIDTEVWNDADKASNARERTPSIPKIPTALRNSQNQKLPQWFKPSVISIGPYYYDNRDCREAQKLKSGHAKKFIEESQQEKDVLYLKIKKKTPELRKCYDNKAICEMTDQTLATIFLLDGCFLLHFINYSSKKDGSDILGFTNHEMAHIKEDLFLLENQLPYKVLKLLFKDAKNSRPSMEEKIKDFVASHVPSPRGIRLKEVNPKPCHLLHYLQGVILGKPVTISPTQKQNEEDDGRGRGRPEWHSCENVQELRKVDIHFKPSPTSYLTDISFEPLFGTTGCLKLPTISMNASTMIIFLNLVAFESSDTTNNLGVISYLCFLNSLIARWDDVKELQAAGILRNFFGEQRDVAQFFNNVCSKLVPNPSAYEDVKLQIQSHVDRHHNCRLRKWHVQCKQKYFSSPWSLMALTAAVIGLSLTAIQTFTSVFPL
ncbi:UPF0481 protein At3g47200-like [Vitis riparia]|uniref:UPF0481 protein At3g47200-like n=1 Tax=Vitis riparia TaxID=96939 RepID=UPI00155A5763|nr:UPF0481 protein At3g47200-like [Vitis riparia]